MVLWKPHVPAPGTQVVSNDQTPEPHVVVGPLLGLISPRLEVFFQGSDLLNLLWNESAHRAASLIRRLHRRNFTTFLRSRQAASSSDLMVSGAPLSRSNDP